MCPNQVSADPSSSKLLLSECFFIFHMCVCMWCVCVFACIWVHVHARECVCGDLPGSPLYIQRLNPSMNLRVAVSGSLAAYWVLCFCLPQSAMRGEPRTQLAFAWILGMQRVLMLALRALYVCSHLHGIGSWLLKCRFILPSCKNG